MVHSKKQRDKVVCCAPILAKQASTESLSSSTSVRERRHGALAPSREQFSRLRPRDSHAAEIATLRTSSSKSSTAANYALTQHAMRRVPRHTRRRVLHPGLCIDADMHSVHSSSKSWHAETRNQGEPEGSQGEQGMSTDVSLLQHEARNVTSVWKTGWRLRRWATAKLDRDHASEA